MGCGEEATLGTGGGGGGGEGGREGKGEGGGVGRGGGAGGEEVGRGRRVKGGGGAGFQVRLAPSNVARGPGWVEDACAERWGDQGRGRLRGGDGREGAQSGGGARG